MVTTERIQELMKQGQWDEAGKALSEMLSDKEFVNEAATGAYLTLLVGYVGALSAAQRKYNDALDVGIALLKASNKKEHEMKEGLDLARVTNEINRLQSKKN